MSGYWRAIPAIYPDLLVPMLVPKSDELVANPYRHGGKYEAKHFFEEGFQARICAGAHNCL